MTDRKMPGSVSSVSELSSTVDSEARKATMEAGAADGFSLANGKRERDSSSESPSHIAHEMDPCLPRNEVDSVPSGSKLKKKYLHASNSSLKQRKRQQQAAGEEHGGTRKTLAELEDAIRSKTGLSRRGVIVAALVLFLLLVFLFVIVVLAATWPHTPHSHLFPICTRAACLHASAQMLPKMNSSAEPCEDFWQYACGGWLKVHKQPPPSRSIWSQDEELAAQRDDHIRRLVATLPHPTRDRSIPWKVKRLYESCMALDIVESDVARPLRRIISELGGWQILREFSVLSWDYQNVLRKLHASYGVSPFFKVSTVPHPHKPLRSIIQVSPAGLGLPHRSYYYRSPSNSSVMAYKRHLRDAVQQLGATSVAAEKFSEDIFHFEKRIAEITPEPEELLDPRHYSNVSLRSLKFSAASIPLHQILSSMFPRAKIGDETEVLVPSPTYLNLVSTIIATTDRGALNNYMMWVLASSYLPYLSRDFREVVNYYQKEMTGASEPIQRWEMCVTTLRKFMSFAVAAMQEQSMQRDERNAAKDVVDEMFEVTRDVVRKSVEKATWLEPKIKAVALEKIGAMGLQVGFPDRVLDQEYQEHYYSALLVQTNDFFQNVLYGVEFLRNSQMDRLVSPIEEFRWLDAMSNADKVTYVAAANKVVVPLRILVPPLFHSQYPVSVLYGGLGMQVASAVVQAVLPWEIFYAGDGTLLPKDHPAMNQSEASVAWAHKFLAQDIASRVSNTVANRTTHSSLIHISAMRHAHLAMVEVLSKLPHTHQPAMETFESDAIFFLTQAQTLCRVSTAQQDDIDNTISFTLHGSVLLKTVLKQVKAFSEAFQCPSQAVYYASRVCQEIL